jgi:DNA-binding beta-propeller fold protein YncE
VTSSNAVSAFARDASTGSLRQTACVAEGGSAGCAIWPLLEGATSAAVSPDGRHLYVAAAVDNAVTAFRVEEGGSRLGVAGCASDDRSGGRCSRGHALDGAAAVSVAPGGRTVYVASGRFSHGLSVFRRNARTGRLSEVGCIARGRFAGACVKSRATAGAATATLSPDGRNVYVLGTATDSLAVLGPDIGIFGRRWRVSARGVVRLRLVCPANARSRCRGLIRLRTVGRVRVRGGRARQTTLGSARFSVAPRRRRSLSVRVAREFIPLLRRSGRLRVRPVVFRAS